MARRSDPDPGTRERLLQAGLALMQQAGIKAVTVRATAAAAGINLGSFVYHFGTRDAFVGELLERWYAPLFVQLRALADVGTQGTPLARLHGVMLRLATWVAENRASVGHLLVDAGSGDGAARRFVQSMDQRHPAVLLQLIGQAQQAGDLRLDSPLHQMLFLLASVAGPLLILQLIAERGLAPPALAPALAAVAADPASIEARLGWALRGLAPETAAGGTP